VKLLQEKQETPAPMMAPYHGYAPLAPQGMYPPQGLLHMYPQLPPQNLPGLGLDPGLMLNVNPYHHYQQHQYPKSQYQGGYQQSHHKPEGPNGMPPPNLYKPNNSTRGVPPPPQMNPNRPDNNL
jgi:hypothetical protein